MSSKISRILGVGLVLAVLASLFVAATPASAGTLSWTSEGSSLSLPIAAGSQIVDMAVAGNGTTIYAVGGVNNVVVGPTASVMAKSTNSGTSWTAVTLPAGVTSVTVVSLAPDVTDGSWLAIITNAGVYISADGGTTWAAAPAIASTSLRAMDVSKAISGSRTLAVIGDNGYAPGSVAVWVLNLGGLFGGTWVNMAADASWNFTNFDNQWGGFAVAISPNYIGDRTIAVVTANSTTAKVQLANTNAKAWNGSVYAAWTNGVAVGNALPSAPTISLALTPNFLGSDPASRVEYVGINELGGAGGLFRVVDPATATPAFASLSSANIFSVAVNAAGDTLIAGAAVNNLVYRVASPGTAAPLSAAASNGYKSPGFATNTNVVVAFAGTSVVAGASGTENAFSVSSDGGKDFSDVSLVNSTFNPVDFTVSADGSKVYMVSYNAGQNAVSLWKKLAGSWTRIFCQADTAAATYVVRAAPENSDVVYLAERQTATNSNLWYSNDGGATTWLPRYTSAPIVDMDVESAAVIWLAGFGQTVSKSTDSGFTYDIASPAKVLGFTPNMIDVIGANSVVVGGIGGQVSYTADGGTTWVAIGGGAGTGNVQVTADKLSSGGNIYAASGTSVYRYTIGTSPAFGSIKSGMAGNAYGVALQGSTLYVVADNTTNSFLYRSLTPSAAVPGWNTTVASPTPAAIVGDAPSNFTLRFTDAGGFPARDLFASVGSDKNPKLWALSATGSVRLESFTDTLTLAGPTLSGPANGTIVQVNSETGQAVDVPFQWSALVAGAVTYDLDVALDSGFTQLITPAGGIQVLNTNLLLLGPNSGPTTGANAGLRLTYQPDVTYYWRVRVDPVGPIDSPYSATGNFKIGTLSPLTLLSPAASATGVPILPTFSWTATRGATTYEITVSDDPTFAIITFSGTSSTNNFAPDPSNALLYNHVYYWRVRASAPATAVTPFANGVFTTMPQPTTTAPPITITETNTTVTYTVPVQQPVIPNYLLWIIIGIGAVLVIALIVLIVRTRARGS